MRDAETRPALFSRKIDEISLSGPDLVELHRAVLDKGMPFRFQARGVSMSPFIKDGDVITVSPLSGALPRRGDVVAFTHPDTERLVIHRVVGKKGRYFLLKGDNVSRVENKVPRKNLLGFVNIVERNSKQVFLGLGPERFLIALLTRIGFLSHVLPFLLKLVRPFAKRLAL
jgi:signal peptidase I